MERRVRKGYCSVVDRVTVVEIEKWIETETIDYSDVASSADTDRAAETRG